MTVPSLLRDIAFKAVDDERPRTRLDRDSDVVKNRDGRMALSELLDHWACSSTQ